MQFIRRAIATIGIATALGGLNLTVHTTSALSCNQHSATDTEHKHDALPAHTDHQQHHSSPTSVPINKNKTPKLTSQQRTAERLINRALEKLHKRQYQAALEDYNLAILFAPKHFLAYVQRGNLRHQLRDHQGAIADYTKAIQNNPTFSSTYINRGIAREIVGDRQQAIADYTQAIQLYPEDGIGYTRRGALRFLLGDVAGAIEDLDTAIQFNSGRADAYLNRGNIYTMLENTQAALADYQKAAQLFFDQGNIAGYLNATNRMKNFQ